VSIFIFPDERVGVLYVALANDHLRVDAFRSVSNQASLPEAWDLYRYADSDPHDPAANGQLLG
jgi:hypothetical protein